MPRVKYLNLSPFLSLKVPLVEELNFFGNLGKKAQRRQVVVEHTIRAVYHASHERFAIF